ncbi:MAG: hypothetical protein AB1Y22_09535 [Cycloclasticus sp.]
MKPHRQAGVVLVFVLLMLVLLSVMAASFSQSMRGGANLMHHTKRQIHGQQLVNAALSYAEFMMTQPVEAARWQVADNAYRINFDGQPISINIYDEAGKLNINRLDRSILLAVLSSLVAEPLAAEKLTDAILDWVDADDQVREYGAEKGGEQPASMGLEYMPANRPFKHLDELMRVQGMNAVLYQALRPLLTVQPIEKTDLSVSSEPVLKVLAKVFELGDAWVQQVLVSRSMAETEFFVPEEMAKYANIKSSSRGQWFELSVNINALNDKRSLVNVLVRRNVGNILPLFVEIDRRVVDE